MNSFRSETFNITEAGKTESFFLQGGLRWQSIVLLSGSSVKIRAAGIRPSVDVKDPNDLPGSFSTSKDIYQEVWGLGARAVQAACVDIGSQPSTWEVSDKGAFIRGQQPAVSVKGMDFSMYTLEFSTKITAGATGWRVAAGVNGGYGAYFVLTSDGPKLQSDGALVLPANQLTAGFGFSIINQAILPSATPVMYNISTPLQDNKWYRITTTIEATGYNISVDGKPLVFVSNTPFQGSANAAWGSGSITAGSFGFAPFLNHAAWYKDVKVTSQNGTVLYENGLTSDEVYAEYAIAGNDAAVCLDGAKRDREIWIGDYTHTGRSISVSSGRFDIMKSMIVYEFENQLMTGGGEGLVPMQPYMGTRREYQGDYYPVQYGETDYEFFFMVVLGDYFSITNDVETMKKYWTGIKSLVATLVVRWLDPSTNLMANPAASWFTAQGGQNATAPTALFVAGLNELTRIATVLGDKQTVKSWNKLSSKISAAVNSELWNGDAGFYSFDLTQPNVSAILATAFTIRAGIASPKQAASGIERLADVFYQIGYKDNSAVGNSSTTQLSPNTQGFLFEALFLANLQQGVPAATVAPAVRNLAEVFWPKMATQNEYYTGASWEYVYADGTPGIGIFTSLAHPWGGAATYVYTSYILGVRPAWDGAEYSWVFDPALEVAKELGLTWAKGTVPLASGGHIKAEWSVTNGKTSMKVSVVGNKDVKVQTKQG